jgi:hypothetical protein
MQEALNASISIQKGGVQVVVMRRWWQQLLKEVIVLSRVLRWGGGRVLEWWGLSKRVVGGSRGTGRACLSGAFQ